MEARGIITGSRTRVTGGKSFDTGYLRGIRVDRIHIHGRNLLWEEFAVH
jgi:hypothetical protein